MAECSACRSASCPRAARRGRFASGRMADPGGHISAPGQRAALPRPTPLQRPRANWLIGARTLTMPCARLRPSWLPPQSRRRRAGWQPRVLTDQSGWKGRACDAGAPRDRGGRRCISRAQDGRSPLRRHGIWRRAQAKLRRTEPPPAARGDEVEARPLLCLAGPVV
jgi:hypothetical protein